MSKTITTDYESYLIALLQTLIYSLLPSYNLDSISYKSQKESFYYPKKTTMLPFFTSLLIFSLVSVLYSDDNHLRCVRPPCPNNSIKIGRIDTNDLFKCSGHNTIYIFRCFRCDGSYDCYERDDEKDCDDWNNQDCRDGKKYSHQR